MVEEIISLTKKLISDLIKEKEDKVIITKSK